MEAKDLRIDNWVEFLGEEMQLMGLTKHNGKNETARHYAEFKGLVPIKLMHVRPIPLTEEWLLKFGWIFNIETDTYERYPNGDARMHLTYRGVNCSFDMLNYVLKSTICNSIKHVHQLQNLYHALTGEELKTN